MNKKIINSVIIIGVVSYLMMSCGSGKDRRVYTINNTGEKHAVTDSNYYQFVADQVDSCVRYGLSEKNEVALIVMMDSISKYHQMNRFMEELNTRSYGDQSLLKEMVLTWDSEQESLMEWYDGYQKRMKGDSTGWKPHEIGIMELFQSIMKAPDISYENAGLVVKALNLRYAGDENKVWDNVQNHFFFALLGNKQPLSDGFKKVAREVLEQEVGKADHSAKIRMVKDDL